MRAGGTHTSILAFPLRDHVSLLSFFLFPFFVFLLLLLLLLILCSESVAVSTPVFLEP